jgi:hypothetical protein
MEKALEQVGFSQDAIRSEEEFQAILESISQQQQEDREAAQLIEGAKALPGASKAVEAGSPLGSMLEAANNA